MDVKVCICNICYTGSLIILEYFYVDINYLYCVLVFCVPLEWVLI